MAEVRRDNAGNPTRKASEFQVLASYPDGTVLVGYTVHFNYEVCPPHRATGSERRVACCEPRGHQAHIKWDMIA